MHLCVGLPCSFKMRFSNRFHYFFDKLLKILNGLSHSMLSILVSVEHITFVYNGAWGSTMIVPLLLVVTSPHVWVAGFRWTLFVALRFVDALFLLVLNSCSFGRYTVLLVFDVCWMMRKVDPTSISTTVSLRFMASSCTLQKSQIMMTDFAGFSTTKTLTICVLVPIWTKISKVPTMGTVIPLPFLMFCKSLCFSSFFS